MLANSICHRFHGIEGMMPQNEDDNTSVTLTELVWQESFRNWVLRPTHVLNRYWQNWKNENPDQAHILIEARQVVLALKVKNRPITDEDIQYVITITRQQLDLPIPSTVVHPLWNRQFRAVAASILMILAIGIGYFVTNTSAPVLTHYGSSKLAGLVVSTVTNQPIQLADGSIVELSEGSELRYPNAFKGDKREVFLKGTARFDVKRNPDQPFLVFANGSVTRVLGTRFTVQAPNGSTQVTVKVQSGKVSVQPESEWMKAQRQTNYQPRTVIITPNQQVVFERVSEQMDKTLISKPLVIQPIKSGSAFNFVNTPVPVVLKTLEQVYGVPIVFDPVIFQNCLVTAPMGEEPLFEKLAIICETIGARYEVIEAHILISGKGCSL